MQDTLILNDTVSLLYNTFGYKTVLPDRSLLDNICSVANVIIAIANIVLVTYIFLHNTRKDDYDREKSRKQNLLKTIVLDHNMPRLYNFFMTIYNDTSVLMGADLSNDVKARVNNSISDRAIELRHYFIDLFLAIDENLYNDLLSKMDDLIDSLTNSIFDEGINLSHKPKYDEVISNKIRESQTSIIGVLFSYTGE